MWYVSLPWILLGRNRGGHKKRLTRNGGAVSRLRYMRIKEMLQCVADTDVEIDIVVVHVNFSGVGAEGFDSPPSQVGVDCE